MRRWGGRTAIVVGIGNAYYGMNISQPATRYFVGLSVAVGGWLLFAVVGQVVLVLLNQYNTEHIGSGQFGHYNGKPVKGATTHASQVPA